MDKIWTQDALIWGVQILIVALGIHLFLRFVRATRGNRLIRGVLVTVLGGYLGLYAIATAISAEELLHLLDASVGFLLVALAIVFQSELRRAIAQLGERSFVGRLIQPAARDTLSQVTKAAQSMASQRIGALIAFERETSLSGYIEEGTPIDADVNARLLESLFHPGTALHDGAVIVKGDRIAAAGCFFPLPQDAELDASLGTRHRAAVGVTEDTDSVVLVVSEETGGISIAREGHIWSKIESSQVEESLKRILQRKDAPRGFRRPSLLPRSGAGWRREVTWFLASLAIATSVLTLSRRDLTDKETRTVKIVASGPNENRSPQLGELIIVLPNDDMLLQTPADGQRLDFIVTGTRGALARFGNPPSGVFELPAQLEEETDPEEAALGLVSLIELERVVWRDRIPGLTMEWIDPAEIITEPIETLDYPVVANQLAIDRESLDSGSRIDTESIHFEDVDRKGVAIRGASGAFKDLELGHPSAFRPLDLSDSTRTEARASLRLSDELIARGLQLAEENVKVLVPLTPAERLLQTIVAPVALVSFDPTRSAELSQWRIPAHAQEVRILVVSTGLIAQDTELDSPVWSEKIAEVIRYVQDQLYVYVDISELDPSDGARGVTIRFGLRVKDWRESLAPILLDDGRSGREAWDLDDLTLQLAGDQEILLEEVQAGSAEDEDPNR